MASSSQFHAGRIPTVAEQFPVDAFEDLRPLVTISRRHQDDYGQRQVVVRIDDRPKTTLLYGQSITVEVPPGTHRLRAHNTLFIKRVWFSVEPGEHLEFVIINRATRLTWAILPWLGTAPLFLSIRRRSLL